MTTDTNRAQIDAAFAKIAAIIRKEEHNDATLFDVISQSIQEHPAFTFVLSSNIADVLHGQQGEVEYNEVLVEAYRRTLFARPDEQCLKFDMFEGSGEKAQEFADLMGRLENTNMARGIAGLVH